jgi:hypothetical protein
MLARTTVVDSLPQLLATEPSPSDVVRNRYSRPSGSTRVCWRWRDSYTSPWKELVVLA